MTQPITRFELGHLSVAVFENQPDPDKSVFRSVSVTRRYYDRLSDEWKSSSASLNVADVPAVIRLLHSAEQWLIGVESQGAQDG